MKRMVALVVGVVVATGCGVGVEEPEAVQSSRAPLAWQASDPEMAQAILTLDADPAYSTQLRSMVASRDFQLELEDIALKSKTLTPNNPVDPNVACEIGYLICRLIDTPIMTCRHAHKMCLIRNIQRP